MRTSFKALTTVILSSTCVLGAAVAPSPTVVEKETDASSGSATASAALATCGAAFQYTGVNESGAEWGTNIPGTLGVDYTWPSPSSVDYFMKDGMNSFRVQFLMERLVPTSGGLTGPFDQTYLNGLKTIVNYITGKAGYAIIDAHNYMIYNGAQITDCNAFATFWTHLSTEFKSNTHVIFDLQNEPNTIPASQVFQCMQTAVTAIRNNGAKQLILVEGTAWTGAWTWTTSGNSDAFAALRDPLNNTAIEMHQYLNSDGSGSGSDCVSGTVGSERLASATAWLQQHGFKGFLGEISGGSSTQCIQAITGALCDMQKSGAWLGFTFWAAGPWWGTSTYQSIEPPNGPALQSVYPSAIKPFIK